ncbi:hypothetical protein C8R44DRAFT_715987 [Mycena epipterygia]|nr:hypothetical protein C8R44DRAFT_715987 [Mycena epipterygia]
MSRPYFLLCIAINEYHTMEGLSGCLNDAESMKSCLRSILGPASPTTICCLTNSGATRSAILSAFHNHLINNANIQRGDAIIIYYAGHGSRVEAPADWQVPGGMVETLCPSDQGLLDAQRRTIPGIPDVTINALLRTLARAKGNNIVSRHSQSIQTILIAA